jgi:hypothetical protein
MNTKTDLQQFWWKVFAALSRLVALGLFLGAHFLINKALERVFPSKMAGMVTFAECVISVLFLLVYGYLAWDMVLVFIPWLKRPAFDPTKKLVEKRDEEGS